MYACATSKRSNSNPELAQLPEQRPLSGALRNQAFLQQEIAETTHLLPTSPSYSASRANRRSAPSPHPRSQSARPHTTRPGPSKNPSTHQRTARHGRAFPPLGTGLIVGETGKCTERLASAPVRQRGSHIREPRPQSPLRASRPPECGVGSRALCASAFSAAASAKAHSWRERVDPKPYRYPAEATSDHFDAGLSRTGAGTHAALTLNLLSGKVCSRPCFPRPTCSLLHRWAILQPCTCHRALQVVDAWTGGKAGLKGRATSASLVRLIQGSAAVHGSSQGACRPPTAPSRKQKSDLGAAVKIANERHMRSRSGAPAFNAKQRYRELSAGFEQRICQPEECWPTVCGSEPVTPLALPRAFWAAAAEQGHPTVTLNKGQAAEDTGLESEDQASSESDIPDDDGSLSDDDSLSAEGGPAGPPHNDGIDNLDDRQRNQNGEGSSTQCAGGSESPAGKPRKNGNDGSVRGGPERQEGSPTENHESSVRSRAASASRPSLLHQTVRSLIVYPTTNTVVPFLLSQ